MKKIKPFLFIVSVLLTLSTNATFAMDTDLITPMASELFSSYAILLDQYEDGVMTATARVVATGFVDELGIVSMKVHVLKDGYWQQDGTIASNDYAQNKSIHIVEEDFDVVPGLDYRVYVHYKVEDNGSVEYRTLISNIVTAE